LSAYDLNSNDNLLLSFGSSPLLPLKVAADKNNLLSNQDLQVTTQVWDDNTGTFKDFGGVNVKFGDKTYLSVDGHVNIFSPKAGTYTLLAEKDNYVRSEKIQVKVADPVTPTPVPTSTPTTIPTTVVTTAPTPIPTLTSTAQVKGANSSKLPNSGPGDNLATIFLSLLGGLYLRSKIQTI
jgi:hypothetical protein